MNYNININQKAIAELNHSLINKLDLKDATILEWMLKFHAEPKSNKLIINDKLYFWGAYQLIINENPLLEINNKNNLSRRIDKLVDAKLVVKHIAKEEGNKTYFSITQICFDLIKRDYNTISTKKSIPIYSKVDTLSTQKSNNNNIIEYISTTTKEKNKKSISAILNSNTQMMETLQMQLRNVDVPLKIKEFELYCLSVKKTHQNNSDLYQHFMAWIRQNQFDRHKDVKKELSYFLKLFNKISNKTYLPSKELEDLLRVQLQNGFTGEQMITAIRNMRSSDDRNWHKKTLFLHATPEHLLKDNNLNKYLNQNY